MAEDRQTELLEEGDVVFLYRPTVEEDDPEGRGDVQRLEMVLRARGGDPIRLCVIGRKRLPDVEEHERNWGFVDMIAHDEARVEKALRETVYGTKTRGERREPAARPAGEGVYAITREDGQMHLSYALELPETPGEVQKALGIAPKASFALSVKNPEKGEPLAAGLGADRKADYPKAKQALFRDRRFDGEHHELLDHEGAEFVLVGARKDPEKAYGVSLDTEKEDYGSADAVRRLRLVKSRHPEEKPLFEGLWD